ncbi:MAG: saccharopine dehydrogenase NADP-binding domain-containing protein [Crenarchaeota archaeon]|nr:saccharopine dehydrogenase NADP-binding domain-containing protein [Thermoproteota archaeon]
MTREGSVLLLGVGKQGRAALWDLLRSDIITRVIAVDISRESEEYIKSLKSDKIVFVRANLSDESELSALMRDVDIVIDLTPPQFTLHIVRLAIKNGKHLVNAMYLIDPSAVSDPESFQALREEVNKMNEIAVEKEITILPEFGLDPGIDLVFTGQAIRELDEVYELYTYGAGIPEPEVAATNPLKYKITWTFDGVLKSYKRPARVIREGRIETIPEDEIFSDKHCHEVEIEGLGILDAYPNGDAVDYAEKFGLLRNLKFAARYSMRWSEHCKFWYKLVKLHFLDDTPVKLGDMWVVPRQFLVALLEPQLQLQRDERDIAIVRVDVRGIKSGKKTRIIYQLIDYRDLTTGLTAMSRTTGFTASIGAQMILRGDISKRGIIFPGTDIPFSVFRSELEKRSMKIERFVEERLDT